MNMRLSATIMWDAPSFSLPRVCVSSACRVKINPVHSMIEGKRLFVVDDSIVRGTTVRTRVAKLRDMGAKEVHFRVSCPPIRYGCFYGIDFPSTKELVAVQHAPEELAALLGLDSLHYLSLEGLKSSVSARIITVSAALTGTILRPFLPYGTRIRWNM